MDQVKIHIGTSADTKGIDRTTDALRRADSAAEEFLQSIKAGVGIDIGGRIVQSIASIPGIFQQAISRGVQFNVTMANAEVGISNVLAKFMNLDKVAAKREAGAAMQQIIDLEPKAAGGLQDLVEGFLATVAASQSAGVSVSENIDLVGRFANAVANANLPTSQLAQEMRAILTGNITPDAALAKILQIDNKQIETAKEAGQLYQFLVEKLGSLGEAGDSAAVRLSSFESAVSKALGEISKPVFDAFIDGVSELTESINAGAGPELRQLGQDIADLVKTGVSFTKWATEHQAVLITMGKAVGLVVAAWGAFQIAALIVGLNRKALAILSNKTAIDAETVSLGRNTAGWVANAGARGIGGAAGGVGARGLAGLGALGGARALLATGVGTATAVAGAVYGSWEMGKGIRDARYGFAIGGKSSAGDMAAASEMRSANAKEIADLANAIKNVKSDPEREAIMADLAKKLQEATAAQSEAGFLEEGRTAQNQALVDHAAAISQLMQVLSSKDGLLSPDQVAAEDERKRSETAAAAAAEANKKILEEAAASRADAARGRIFGEGLQDAQTRAEAGDGAGAREVLAEMTDLYSAWLEQTRAAQANLSGDQLKDNLEFQAELEDYIRQIKEARADLPEALAEADKEASEKSIAALREQISLLEAQGQKRLADLEALSLREDQLATRRKQIEDEIAAKRLDLESEIGTLQDETATAREAREIQYAAAAKQRANELAAAQREANVTAGTAPGELFTGTNRRRGLVTSNSFEQQSGLGAGQGARALNDWSGLVAQGSQGFGTAGTGMVSPGSIPPAPAAPGAGGGQNQQTSAPSADPAASASAGAKSLESLTKFVETIAKAADDAVKKIQGTKAADKIREIGTAVATKDEDLQRQIDDVKAQIV